MNLGIEELMVKPVVKKREQVAVVIKNPIQQQPKIQLQQPKIQKPKEELEEGEIEEEEEQEEELVEVVERKEPIKAPLFINKTNSGFDRDALLKKLADNKLNKVTIKPLLNFEKEREKVKEIAQIIPEVVSKKVKTNRPFVIQDENEEVPERNEEEEEIKRQQAAEILGEIEELPDEVPDEFVMKPKPKKRVKIVEPVEEAVVELVEAPKKKGRLTKKPEKGVAVLGPETIIDMGDTLLTERIPKKTPPINIKVSEYYMNNRERFINFINSTFEPYHLELQENRENISCDNIGKKGSSFSLLTHQKIVRDYMNLVTPYRGLLLYHGLGSGKTCTSIAIAEGMKDSKQIYILTPASLRANYIEEIKKCGDALYKRNQYWEWISTDENPEALDPMAAILNLDRNYIIKKGGAWFVNVKKKSNYDTISDEDKTKIEEQLDLMIKKKYHFENYNGLNTKKLKILTQNFTINPFDNSVIIIDEAHNLISRIVNKIKKEKPISETKRGEKEHLPISLSVKLYEYLLSAKNARIILLTGTPIINYVNEFGILFNILRGYIKTWNFTLSSHKPITKELLQDILTGEKSHDYLEYVQSNNRLTITRNPFGFKSSIKKSTGYKGVYNNKEDQGQLMFETDINDDEFEQKIIGILKNNDINVQPGSIEIKHYKALPDTMDDFSNRYIDSNTLQLKNVDAIKRRIVGLSSYFRSAQESLLPKYNKTLGLDYHVVRIPMSDYQFRIYENARKDERKTEKKRPTTVASDVFEEKASTYRIFSRLFCNFVMPERPIPERKGKSDKNDMDFDADGKKIENKKDLDTDNEGEIEGDGVLDEIGGVDYKERLRLAIKHLEDNSNDFLTLEALRTYSPKFLHMFENINDPENEGLHLVYSQFRTAEGIGLFCSVLEKNGYTQFKIKKNSLGVWEINIPEEKLGLPTYALYTGTETVEEKEIIRHIYNGEWDDVPDSLSRILKLRNINNDVGQVIKILMITSSGSEGINLRNTRFVHIMEPYWHPVRLEQVIGRARRICSHTSLPKKLQTVEVFVYIMTFTPEQIKSDSSIELKRKDLSKLDRKTPITSDQFLYEISEIKAGLTAQLTDAIKESAFDCYIYSNGKCFNFVDPSKEAFSYVPNYADQQSDTIVRSNQKLIEWKGTLIKIEGVKYVRRRISDEVFNIYDLASYEAALKDPSINPLLVGTLELNERGEKVFKAIT